MRHLRHHLKKSSLFEDMSDDEIYTLLQTIGYRTATYDENQMVASEGAPCSHLSIVLLGSVKVHKIYPSGRSVTLDRLAPGSTFGEATVFSRENQYPATVTATSPETTIMFIPRDEISKMCHSHPKFLENFLALLSDKIINLNRRLTSLSHKTLKKKLVNYLLEEAKRQDDLDLVLPLSRRELARDLGVPRPSLSREFSNLQNEELIEFDRNNVHIKDPDGLRDHLWE